MDIGTQMRLTGLATGLDTDEVIRNMGRIHTMKIDAVNRDRQLAVWRQEIYRNTMSMLSGFQKSFLDVGNPANNFRSATAFAKFSFNLSLGGDAAAAAKIMSVTANADLKNFKQSVQAVAQLATKETLNGRNMGLQGIQSKGFDVGNFANIRHSYTKEYKDEVLESQINNALRYNNELRVDFKDWLDTSYPGEFAAWDSNFDEWLKDATLQIGSYHVTSGDNNNFEKWCRETNDITKTAFENWRGVQEAASLPADWSDFWTEFRTDRATIHGINVDDALDDFKYEIYNLLGSDVVFDDDYASLREFQRTDGGNARWEEFLAAHTDPDDPDPDVAEVAAKIKSITKMVEDGFGDGSYMDVGGGFNYAFFGISIDGATRTITLTNDELEAVYYGNNNHLDRTQAFADLVNDKIKAVFGKEFNDVVKVVNGELNIDKPGSNVTVFEETGFDSLKRMGFPSNGNNRNFSGKNVGDLFPDMFVQANDTTRGLVYIDKDETPLYKSGGDYVDRNGRIAYVDKDGDSVFRVDDNNFIDKDGRQVFLDENDKLVYSNGDNKYVDKNGKEVSDSKVKGHLSQIAITSGIGIEKITEADAKPLYNDLEISINGSKKIVISGTDTISSMLNKINNSDAGVNMTYDAVGDRFVFTSIGEGSANNFVGDTYFVSQDDAGNHVLNDTGIFFRALGVIKQDMVTDIDGKDKMEFEDHQEAQNLRAVINGQEVVKFSNSFQMDGMTYTFHETFNSSGIDSEGKIIVDDTSEEIKIQVNKNTDEIISNIKNFVEEYNKIVDHINTLMYQKKDRDYPPLTEDQKKGMKEEEIKAWEDKAKSGLLNGDMELRKLLDQMRMAVYQDVEGAGISMAEIGITTSPNYMDGGRLVINEEKLNSALEGKYDSVIKLFTKSSEIPYGSGNQSQRYKENGLSNRLDDILKDAVRTSTVDGKKGYLVEKAGLLNDATSVTNQITKQIEQYDKRVSVLLERWKVQEKALYQKFAAMETMMMKLQTQQNNLASFMAGNGN